MLSAYNSKDILTKRQVFFAYPVVPSGNWCVFSGSSRQTINTKQHPNRVTKNNSTQLYLFEDTAKDRHAETSAQLPVRHY